MNRFSKIYSPLISWYLTNSRSVYMPWRKSKNPYNIWVSEIMLQQTQIERAIPYYERWIKKFPSIKSVALSNESSILKMWAGLGYYKRALNFHRACKILNDTNGGRFPESIDSFIDLPGVGDYISSAVFSIAFNEPVPVYDVNVNRFISRLLSIDTTKVSAKNKAKKYLRELVSRSKNASELNQAMMDLGRYICTISGPSCDRCPVSGECIALDLGTTSKYPIKTKKKTKPHYKVVIGFIWNGDKLLINKRPTDKMLGGMWEFPGGKLKDGENPKRGLEREIMEEFNINVKIEEPLDRFTHSYSHFSIDIEGYNCKYLSGKIVHEDNMPYRWIRPKQLASLPFPRASEKFFEKLI